MDEKPFTNREIKAMFDHISKELASIGREVKFTNGKVRELTAWRQQLTGAGGVIKGIWAIAGVFVIAMAFAMFNMYVEFKSIDNRIQTFIQEELSTYEFEIAQ